MSAEVKLRELTQMLSQLVEVITTRSAHTQYTTEHNTTHSSVLIDCGGQAFDVFDLDGGGTVSANEIGDE